MDIIPSVRCRMGEGDEVGKVRAGCCFGRKHSRIISGVKPDEDGAQMFVI